MDYLYYDYKNTKTEITLSNYEKFISNGKIYKYYLFDLFLMRFDSNQSRDKIEKAKNYVNIQKALFILPHLFNFSVISILYYRGFFDTHDYIAEKKIIKRLFCFYIICRIVQKGILKYQVDKLITSELINKSKL